MIGRRCGSRWCDVESSSDISALRQALVDKLKNAGQIRSPRVEAAFRAVPRHLFVPGVPLEKVYSDESVITKTAETGTAISSSSQPAIMAIMLEQLELEPGHRVLEIGAGTGYNAALIAQIVGETGQVVTMDIDEDIVQNAREHLAAAGFDRVQVLCGDGGLGYADAAPYDRIILTVGAWDITPAWREQLKSDGRLLMPLSLRGPQKSIAFEKSDGFLASVSIEGCGFMRLRGAFAGPDTQINLGPKPGLCLTIDDPSNVNADALYRSLTDASREISTGVRIKQEEIFQGLNSWLALREPGFCSLASFGEMMERGIVPCLFGWGWLKQCHSDGLLHGANIALLMRPPGSPPPWDCAEDVSFEIFVKSFGQDDSRAHHLIEQIKSWDGAGRPSSKGLHVRAYPKEYSYVAGSGETVIDKRWTRLVLDWKTNN